MRESRRFLIIAAATAVLAPFAGGCSSGQSADPAPPAPSGGLSAAEIEAIYEQRTEAGRTRYTEADVRFMTGMIHHHAQAIEMARLAPDRSSNPSIQTLAARIINAQQDEIALMESWLRRRDQAVPEIHPTGHGAGHGAAGGMQAMHMPGMATAAQLAQLEQARGTAFDRLFLELMIHHHGGAVTMVHELFATDGAAQDNEVFKFASDVQVDQATEVARMERMLSALTDGDR